MITFFEPKSMNIKFSLQITLHRLVIEQKFHSAQIFSFQIAASFNSYNNRDLTKRYTFEETYIVKNTEYGHEIMKRINEENSDFENETGTDMIDVLEDDEIVIDDD